jgi:hypothetical protein
LQVFGIGRVEPISHQLREGFEPVRCDRRGSAGLNDQAVERGLGQLENVKEHLFSGDRLAANLGALAERQSAKNQATQKRRTSLQAEATRVNDAHKGSCSHWRPRFSDPAISATEFGAYVRAYSTRPGAGWRGRRACVLVTVN